MANRSEFHYSAAMTSSLGESHRYAGTGITEDNYDDDYQPNYYTGCQLLASEVKFPSDGLLKNRKDWEKLNGECVTVQKGKTKAERISTAATKREICLATGLDCIRCQPGPCGSRRGKEE